MKAEKSWHVPQASDDLYVLTAYVTYGWLSTKAEVKKEFQLYQPFQEDIAVTDEMLMKDRRIIVLDSPQHIALMQLHITYMGIEKTILLAHKSVYWININNDIENAIKSCLTCFEFQAKRQANTI